MKATRELYTEIADEIDRGDLSFHQIATKYGVTYDDVDQIAHELQDQIDYDEDYVRDNDYFDDY